MTTHHEGDGDISPVPWTPLDLSQLADASSEDDNLAIQQTRQAVSNAFIGCTKLPAKRKADRLEVSAGQVSTSAGKRKLNLTLVRRREQPATTYLVETSQPEPSQALLVIGPEGYATPAHDNTASAPLEPKAVYDLVRRIEQDARSRHQFGPRRKVSLVPLKPITITGIVILVIALGIFWIVSSVKHSNDGMTTEAIQSDQIWAADGQAHPVGWTEQFDHKLVKKLTDQESLGLPVTPRAVNNPSGTNWTSCSKLKRDIREGERYKAVFHGQGSDKFTIKVDAQSNVIEICRKAGNGNDDGSQPDAVIIQRVD